ncbi:MAG: YerC/YecD family TrpR-related protein [Candidatus Nomurabacteria bacterium]|nr:YerC/YecD family TrpR-related protein [Candidatus Nomurabacteria bacterium]
MSNSNYKINWNLKENRELVSAILALKNTDQAERFFEDLLTKGEFTEFSKRFLAANMLSRSNQYAPIIEKTGLSSTTIARVSKCLKGALGGYRLAINNMSTRSTTLGASHHSNHSKLKSGLS